MLKKKKWLFLSGAAVFFFILNPMFSIAEDADEITVLKKQVETLQQRIEALETQKSLSDQKSSVSSPDQFAWDPFSEIHRMQEEMDQMFQNSFFRSGQRQGVFSNRMSFDSDFNVREVEDGYEIQFDMKGLDNEKVDVEVNGRSITVKGEHSTQKTEEGDVGYFSAQSFGSFIRTIPIPEDGDATKVKTEKSGETLTIFVPKR